MNDQKPYDLSKEGLANSLAKFLGTTVVAQYMAHGYHWNVKGPEFTQFHKFFGKIYEDWSGEEDRIAEYIRILGFDAPHDLNQFLMLACLDSKPCSGNPMEMGANLYEANLVLKNCVEDIFNIASAINAQGIADWAASRMDAHSKWNWMIGTTIGADAMQIQTLTPTLTDMGKSKAEVLLKVIGDSPVSELQPMQMLNDSIIAAGYLVPEEADLADALREIVQEHGKFNDDNTGVWAGYDSAEKNAENAKIGVKCGNCVFFNSPNGCEIITAEVEEGGLCRFAVLPDGSVTAAGGAGAPAEVLDMSKIKKGKGPVTLQSESITADADYGGKCPPATQDIVLNIKNRQNAIDNVGYGPLNPDEPNEEFWQDKADRWKITPVEASKSICGNCVFFDRRPKTLDCIETGIADGGSGEQSAWDAIDQAELGYCTALDFKCAASRTCNAWAAGGPVTEDTVTATAGSKPAPKKDQIKGSDKNKKGSASGSKKITFSKAVETSLRNKVKEHNDSVESASKKVSLSKLKAVYRRGAGAFSSSHRPDQNRASWSMARVNAFLHLVKSGSPKNPKYTTDNDLLPQSHPKKSVTASGENDSSFDSAYAESLLIVEIGSPESYATPEDAIYAFTEFAGLGYEALPVFRAAWKRGVAENEDPFTRASDLAINLYDSKDADLLPKQEKE
jgi:starvation-inducible DNA-binding protein